MTTLAELAARGYVTDEWARWQQGDCLAYAVALTGLAPALHVGMLVADLGGGDQHELHFYAYDDTHAYDSAGRHPLPYLGIDPQPWVSAVLDVDPADYDKVYPDDLADAVAHAHRHGIVAGMAD